MKTAQLLPIVVVGCLALLSCERSSQPAAKTAKEAKAAERSGAVRSGATRPIAQAPSGLIAGVSRAIAYSGFRRGQHPGKKHPTDAQLLEDLRLLVRGTFRLIRLYDAGEVSRRTLKLIAAHELDIKVMLGAWLEAEISNHEGCKWLTKPIPAAKLAENTAENKAEVGRAIALAKAYPTIIVAVNVGNEALVSWNDHRVTLRSMLAHMQRVKAAISQPVSTADNYVPWAKHGAALAAVADFAAVHTYPQWEGKPVAQAMAFTIENIQAVRDAVGTKPIAIAEAGWATIGEEFGARAGQPQQLRYYNELMSWSKKMNITTFFFEAFDEPWKGDPGRPRGAEKHWGLFNVDRQPKQVIQKTYPGLKAAPATD